MDEKPTGMILAKGMTRVEFFQSLPCPMPKFEIRQQCVAEPDFEDGEVYTVTFDGGVLGSFERRMMAHVNDDGSTTLTQVQD